MGAGPPGRAQRERGKLREYSQSLHVLGRSGDSTARIWDLNARGEDGQPRAKVLKHFNRANEKAKDVTTLDWNGDGTLLATGSYDGLARIWSRDGARAGSLYDTLGMSSR